MNKVNRLQAAIVATLLSVFVPTQAQQTKPLRLAIAGLSHGHAYEVLSKADRGDFVIVGIAEKDDSIRANSPLTKKVAPGAVYADLEQMLDETKPEAVIVYESVFDHLRVVEACAPRKIHVMVEKPLAVNSQHAQKMAQLARQHGILLLTNYETTWYSTNHEAHRLINHEGSIGEITRINVFDGHEGPKEIGCSPEFLAWLTHPKLNGGGAVIDFGCYGANLCTWLMNGKEPLSVSAILKQQKPHVYPNVDDDATIIVEYDKATVQIMASWNWPMGRKDMHIYGSKGYICQDTPQTMRIKTNGSEKTMQASPLKEPYNDAFKYLKAAIRNEIEVMPTDLSSLENNLTVVKILEAAIESSRTGKKITFPK